jgi:SAM-dependent methyltransferase
VTASPDRPPPGRPPGLRRRLGSSPLAPILRPVVRAARGARRRVARGLVRAGVRLDRAALAPAPAGPPSSWGELPLVHRPRPAPVPFPEELPTPPAVERPMDPVRTILPARPRPRFDVALFEQLNAEYEARPLVPEPRRYDHDAMIESAVGRLRGVHRAIDLAGRTVLEVGCGGGYELWFAAHALGADAWGVDVVERRSWPALAGERVHLQAVDLAEHNPFPPGMFDRAMSFTVWEHVEHPYRLLVETHRALRPGGLFWLKANLHRGPQASHLYRHISFPFPHLLFSDDVISDALARKGVEVDGAAWVNRLTWAQYEDYFRAIGFRILALRFRETPLDAAFYQRFEDVLGRYPRWELSRDFFEVVLEKVDLPRPAGGASGEPRAPVP